MRRLTLSLVLSLFATTSMASTLATDLFISEYVEGSSNNKAIEIYNGTAGTVNISAYSVRVYFNGSTTAAFNLALAGNLPAGRTYVLVHNSADAAMKTNANQFTTASWFNGDDAIALFRGSTLVDVIGQIGVQPSGEWGSGDTSTADNTLRRKVSVCAGDTNPSDPFNPSLEWEGFPQNTFGGLGSHTAVCSVVPPDPVVPVREIYEIQGSGATSPYAGQTVETRDNVVTAVGPQGFFMQTPDFRADASSSTSNGIYVFTGTPPSVAVGNQVKVKGSVIEFFTMTEFSGGLTVTVTASSVPLPARITLASGFSQFEQYEGMLVRVTNGRAAAGTDEFGSTMIVAASSRPFRTPGLGGDAHPEIFEVDPVPLGGSAPSIAGGATIAQADGAMAFSFGDYVVWTTTLSFTNPPFPRPVRVRNAGELTVGAQNLFRLFDDQNDPAIGEPVPSTAVYQARLAAFSNHVRNVLGSPDVVAVSEVENLSTLTDLAHRLNADQAGLSYTAYVHEGNDVGGIDVGFLVRGSVSVSSVTQLNAGQTWVPPGSSTPELLNDRPPLLLRGAYTANGLPFPIAVIAVHQRSLIDVETSLRVRAKREQQALSLAAAIQSLQASAPGIRVVAAGDFNAFELSDGYVDVMGILTSVAGLTNQVNGVAASDRYSYVEEGVAQVLDHSLTSASLNPFVRGLQFSRSNADAPALAAGPSDHDGVVLYVMSDHDADGLPDDGDQCPTGDARPTVILAGCDSGAPNLRFPGGCTLADKINAARANAKNHGQFVSEIGKLLNDLMKDGQLTGAQKGAIEACVARWN